MFNLGTFGTGEFPASSAGAKPPIDPRMLLFHQLMGRFHPGGQGAIPGPGGPFNRGGIQNPNGQIHGFGPGGVVTGPGGGGGAPQPNDLVAQLAALSGGQPGNGAQATDFVPPAPNVPEGTYMGAYAAQGLRTSNPAAAAQLWEHRHPGQVHGGHIPGWVTDALGGEVGRAAAGVSGMHQGHVSDAHSRAHQLARHIARMRKGRGVRRSLRNVMPPNVQPPQQTYMAQ